MGMITIIVEGSFPESETGEVKYHFSAMAHGHAQAIGDAINQLSEMLPHAINKDHRLHDKGQRPESTFGIHLGDI